MGQVERRGQGAAFTWLAIAVGNTWAREEWDTAAHIPLTGRTAIAVTDSASYLLWRDGQDRLMLAQITFASP